MTLLLYSKRNKKTHKKTLKIIGLMGLLEDLVTVLIATIK